MGDRDDDLRDLLRSLDPKARDDLRSVLRSMRCRRRGFTNLA
jgi:hypothetical protein